MPSGGYSLSITSLPYTVLWRPSAYGYNLRYGEGRMLQGAIHEEEAVLSDVPSQLMEELLHRSNECPC